MRSKLLSLHLVLSILTNHLSMFVDPNIVIHSYSSRERTPFIHAIKQYLCLALSRNAVSPVIQVFELSCEIFWRVLSGMRSKLKKEIEVLLNEIFLPILEMRNSTVRQKSILLAVFGRLAQDPQALVDIYLNYDCDRASLDNIYERYASRSSLLVLADFPATKVSLTSSPSSARLNSPPRPNDRAPRPSLLPPPPPSPRPARPFQKTHASPTPLSPVSLSKRTSSASHSNASSRSYDPSSVGPHEAYRSSPLRR